jgi:hypothetical protein
MKKDNFWKKYSQNKLLLIGIIFIAVTLFFFFNQFAVKSKLKRVDGTIRNANTYIETITDWRGNKSQKSELIFYMKEHKKRFYLSRNIGNEYYDKKYDNILKDIINSDTITVLVRSRWVGDYEPKIFQISNGNKIILAYDEVRKENSFVAIYLLILGIVSLIFFYKMKYPDKWHEIFNQKDNLKY